MGKQAHRLAAIKNRLRDVERFVQAYQRAQMDLVAGTQADLRENIAPEIAVIGPAIIWPCKDGAVVLWYAGTAENAIVETRPVQGLTMKEFFNAKDVSSAFDEDGHVLSGLGIHIEYPRSNHLIVAGASVAEGGKIYRTKHAKADLIGWDVSLSDPKLRAKEDFDTVYIARNLASVDVPVTAGMPVAAVAAQRAQKLLAEFERAIATAEREEDLQNFLSQHPELIYPEYITCYRKWKLGSEFISDFVFENQGFSGKEYIFVELERANKRITINSGQFSADFTQAKGQLNDWQSWLTNNISYVQRALPGFYMPSFHLIMGRSGELEAVDRERLLNEFSGTRKLFSTYDDLLEKYKVTVNRLLEM